MLRSRYDLSRKLPCRYLDDVASPPLLRNGSDAAVVSSMGHALLNGWVYGYSDCLPLFVIDQKSP